MRDGGIPDGVFNMVAGPGETVGAELQENEGVDGILFTGSFEVGFDLYKHFAKRFPKPVIVEMGGKNPAIVSKSADLDEAAEGVMRSAFGLSGQKCSANSRVYVERPVYDQFLQILTDKVNAIKVGDPVDRQNWMGPIINQRALSRYDEAVAEARHDGRIVAGGERLTERRSGGAATLSRRPWSPTCPLTIAFSRTSFSYPSWWSLPSIRSMTHSTWPTPAISG